MDGDPQLQRQLLEARLHELPSPPADVGTVALVVIRPNNGERLTPPRCRLLPDQGLEGDRWVRGEKPLPEAQISVMRADVARVIANGQPLALFGDNLLVDLDLSKANLPVGTRLRVGTATCEVTSKPHTGCRKFAERFGLAGIEVVAAEAFREWHLRGIYFRVLEAGEVGPGDRLEVLDRCSA